MPAIEPRNEVERAIISRRSVRRFLPAMPDPALIERMLNVAARAPSGTNMQPWQAHALIGAAKTRLSEHVLAAHHERAGEYEEAYAYYPPQFFEPYTSRRRKIGWDLYGLLGIEKGQRERMHEQHGRNYLFFDAPVGIIFTIDRRLERGSWLDYGMFLDNVMILARSYGLDTCPQAAFAKYDRLIRDVLSLPDEEIVVCGMAIGYADDSAPENTLVTEREDARRFTTFYDWNKEIAPQ